ncbi:MAG: PhoH family protein, partial [Deltaproteobacteria bacterium]|nr:PhoH family protein [Deltaproteobacteria bacterium]
MLKNKNEALGSEKIVFPSNDFLRNLCGEHDCNIKLIERLEAIKLAVRGNVISLLGSPHSIDLARNLLEQLYRIGSKGYPLHPADIQYAHRILAEDAKSDLERIFLDTVFISAKKRIITPKSIAQKLYIDAIRSSDMVFGVGPAGTGKTYLAMAMAISALLEK